MFYFECSLVACSVSTYLKVCGSQLKAVVECDVLRRTETRVDGGDVEQHASLLVEDAVAVDLLLFVNIHPREQHTNLNEQTTKAPEARRNETVLKIVTKANSKRSNSAIRLHRFVWIRTLSSLIGKRIITDDMKPTYFTSSPRATSDVSFDIRMFSRS